MVTIEQIDEFRKRTHSSYEDAKFFLERNNGDILDAIIDFERSKSGKSYGSHRGRNNEDTGKRFAEILQKGFDTRIIVEDKGSVLFTIPVILLFFFIPMWFIIGLFFLFLVMLGYKFSIRDIKSQNINVDSVFHSIHEKMKETSNAKKANEPGAVHTQNGKSQPPVVSTMTHNVKEKSGDDPNKDEGYKEYTIE